MRFGKVRHARYGTAGYGRLGGARTAWVGYVEVRQDMVRQGRSGTVG